MQKEENFIVAIELGSSKITAIAGRKQPDGAILVLATVQETSDSFIRKGRINNFNKMTTSLKNMKSKLEEKLKMTISAAYVGIGGMGMHTVKNTVTQQLSEKMLITADMVKNVKDLNISRPGNDKVILEDIPQDYKLGTQTVLDPVGSMVVDIGGGTTDIAVISLGGIVTSSSLRLAGNRLDEAIAMHLRDLLGIKIGERTAEVIKIKIGSILPFEDGRERDMIISGQDVLTEQPKEVTIQSEDVRQALQAPCEEMVVHIKETFNKTNPDLASDIIQNGILLTGGGGLLSGLDRYLSDKLEIPVWVSETALTNVVTGCLKVLETPTALKQTLMRSK